MTAMRHELENAANLATWKAKPLLREVYSDLYARVERWIDPAISGSIVEIGTGIGNFAPLAHCVIATDRSIEAWLDVTCSAYQLPFRSGSISHIVLIDVFHHLSAPEAFLSEAARVLVEGGRVIILDPYIGVLSAVVYGILHSEPIGWHAPIHAEPTDDYYAAQGNATRFFFRDRGLMPGWRIAHREAFAAFAYLLSGGFTRPAFYPRWMRSILNAIDRRLSVAPLIFAARCVVVLLREGTLSADTPVSDTKSVSA